MRPHGSHIPKTTTDRRPMQFVIVVALLFVACRYTHLYKKSQIFILLAVLRRGVSRLAVPVIVSSQSPHCS